VTWAGTLLRSAPAHRAGRHE